MVGRTFDGQLTRLILVEHANLFEPWQPSAVFFALCALM